MGKFKGVEYFCKPLYTFSTNVRTQSAFLTTSLTHTHLYKYFFFFKCLSTLNTTLTHPHSSGSIWINSGFSFLPKNTLTCRLLCMKPLTAVLFSHVCRNKFVFVYSYCICRKRTKLTNMICVPDLGSRMKSSVV